MAGLELGPQRRCTEFDGLKIVEDKWILRLEAFYGDSGLNKMEEFTAIARGNFPFFDKHEATLMKVKFMPLEI